MTHRQEILGAVYNCPQYIPMLYKQYNKDLLTKILRGLLPRRIGLEFECAGLIYNAIEDKTIEKGYDLKKHYNVYKIKVDLNRDRFNRDRLDYNNLIINYNIIEHRISFLGYKQIAGLHSILQDMSKVCKLTESGIHIHIDINDILSNIFNNHGITILQEQFEKRLNKIESIVGKYYGTVNYKKAGCENKKCWVNIRNTTKESVEIRIAPLTFDYTTIIDWCIKLTAMVEEIKRELKITTKYHFKKDL